MKLKNKVLILLKTQSLYFCGLILIFVVPLLLLFRYSPYQIPYIQYFVLGFLYLFQYMRFNEKNYRLQKSPLAKKHLTQEKGKIPSRSKINQRLNEMVEARGISLFFAGALIILLIVTFKKI